MITAALAPSDAPNRITVAVETDHEGRRELWWETTSGAPPPQPDRLDAAAIALVHRAMTYHQDLHLAGPVSQVLLANLDEFIDAWTMWRPDIFGPVTITADEVIGDRSDGPGPQVGRLASAFSGGIDASYAVAAHQLGWLGRRSQQVSAAVLVQGFDLPLDDQTGFDRAHHAARAITDELGIDLVTVRTNWREITDQHWQMAFAAALGAALHLFADRAATAGLAADNTYANLTIPWGSNPITNPLLASSRMAMTLTGSAANRTEKCRALATLPSLLTHLRVCWEGPEPGRNCGHCEKCVRTKLNFVAAGVGTVDALGPLSIDQLDVIDLTDHHVRVYYHDLLASGLGEPYATKIGDLVARSTRGGRAPVGR